MHKYILKRLLMLIPVILGVTFIVFFILNLSPGDPAAMILGEQATAEALEMKREELGLNDPLLVRYFNYMKDLLRGDMGVSYRNSISVWEQVTDRFPNTVVLAIAGLMSDDTLENVNRDLENAKAAAFQLGVSREIDPFMTLSFMSLPVIPTLRLTTRGVIDVLKQQYI